LWPIRPTFVLLPYWVYLLALVAMAGLALLHAAKDAPFPTGTADSPPASGR
jgi:hypothetical protein